jgi:hypothetical protein
LPTWLIHIVVLGVSYFRIKELLKYRRDTRLFTKEFAFDWIDPNQRKAAIRSYVRIEVAFFVFLSTFPFLTYFDFFRPSFLRTIAFTVCAFWVAASVWWFKRYSTKNESND